MAAQNTSIGIDNKIDLLKEEKGTVLIVDDEYYTIELLKTLLTSLGYSAIGAQSGREALDKVAKEKVDLIILDIMMPEMNGYEVCKIIKANKKTRMIPILVISALSEIQDNIKAMEVGAEGFLSKPFNNQLVIAYVRSLIKVKKLTDEIIKLDALKDDLTKMIIHDLKNPLTSAMGFVNLSLKGTAADKTDWYLSIIKNSLTDALNFIDDLHDITRLEADKLTLKKTEENIYLIIAELIDAMTPVFEKRGLVAKIVSECNLKHKVDAQVLKRIIQNIFANAVRYADRDTTIMVHAYKKKGALIVRISNEGETIHEKHRKKVFEKFGQVELKRSGENIGTGLGLAYCKMAVEAHKGRIWLESPAVDFNNGVSFIFEIK